MQRPNMSLATLYTVGGEVQIVATCRLAKTEWTGMECRNTIAQLTNKDDTK
jgi:hypothetical protein